MMQNQKIFLVEDDEKIVELLITAFKQWGFKSVGAQNFRNVTSEILAENPDLILMDINLPYFNGFHLTQEIRKTSTIPIIFLSSQEDKMSKVMAMNFGADDFIEKPFDLEILIAKIQAILRRAYTFSKNYTGLKFKGYELDLKANTVCLREKKIFLSKNEMCILHIFFENQNRLISRKKIMEKLWGNENFIDKNTLAVNINRLRKKLMDIELT
ncbi:MAG: response regulator transcription factor [Streptococcaceae bacterium]|jgi:DNA-binding response OmpR family regulator|nr:response regulator transcription factor [Streptococcaceae bacterium]